MTLYSRLSIALEQGMNIKLVLLATGLDRQTFWTHMENQLFTNEQQTALMEVLKEWKMNEETKIPEITEEVRQYFKKHNDDRVERQKKIIVELKEKLITVESEVSVLQNRIRFLENKDPFYYKINWPAFYIGVLKVTAFLVGLKIIFT